jgi:hypothetical protein
MQAGSNHSKTRKSKEEKGALTYGRQEPQKRKAEKEKEDRSRCKLVDLFQGSTAPAGTGEKEEKGRIT